MNMVRKRKRFLRPKKKMLFMLAAKRIRMG